MSDSEGDQSVQSQHEDTESSYDSQDDDQSSEVSNSDGIVYLSSDDDDDELPVLLGGSSRRPKTIENYVAPPHLRDTVYRCREYPRGVYINPYGEICPNDHRSGRFQRREHNDIDEGNAFHEVSRRRRSPQDEDQDDEWVATSDETDESEEEDSDEEVEAPGRKRKREQEDEEEEWKELPHDEDTPLTDEQKKALFMQDLQSAAGRTATMEAHLERTKHQTTNARKLNDQLGEYVEEWLKYASREARGVQMVYDSKFVTDQPSCSIQFVKKIKQDNGRVVPSVLATGSMNCTTRKLECHCHQAFTSSKQLYLHGRDCPL